MKNNVETIIKVDGEVVKKIEGNNALVSVDMGEGDIVQSSVNVNPITMLFHMKTLKMTHARMLLEFIKMEKNISEKVKKDLEEMYDKAISKQCTASQTTVIERRVEANV